MTTQQPFLLLSLSSNLTIPYFSLTPAYLLQFLFLSSSPGLWSLLLFITKLNGTWFLYQLVNPIQCHLSTFSSCQTPVVRGAEVRNKKATSCMRCSARVQNAAMHSWWSSFWPWLRLEMTETINQSDLTLWWHTEPNLCSSLPGQPLWRASNFPWQPEGYYIMFPAFKGHSRRLFITKAPYRALYLDDWHIGTSERALHHVLSTMVASRCQTCQSAFKQDTEPQKVYNDRVTVWKWGKMHSRNPVMYTFVATFTVHTLQSNCAWTLQTCYITDWTDVKPFSSRMKLFFFLLPWENSLHQSSRFTRSWLSQSRNKTS